MIETRECGLCVRRDAEDRIRWVLTGHYVRLEWSGDGEVVVLEIDGSSAGEKVWSDLRSALPDVRFAEIGGAR